MKRKILLWLIERLYRLAYEPINLDNVNRKLVKPVPGLVIDGVQYFQFVNVADMPHMRLVHYNYMREEMVMGIDRELQLKIIDRILAANQERDHNTVGAVAIMFRDIVTNITTVESLYNVASLIYFDAREDIAGYDFDYNQAKIAKFKTIRDKSFFFSHLLQNSLKIKSGTLPADINQYLNENAVKLKAWKSILSELTESPS